MSAETNSGIFVALEAAFVIALALVFGIKEFRNLRRFDRERAARNKAEAEARRRTQAGEHVSPPGAAS